LRHFPKEQKRKKEKRVGGPVLQSCGRKEGNGKQVKKSGSVNTMWTTKGKENKSKKGTPSARSANSREVTVSRPGKRGVGGHGGAVQRPKGGAWPGEGNGGWSAKEIHFGKIGEKGSCRFPTTQVKQGVERGGVNCPYLQENETSSEGTQGGFIADKGKEGKKRKAEM